MSWYHLKEKNFISIKDWTKDELDILLKVASDLKCRYYNGEKAKVWKVGLL